MYGGLTSGAQEGVHQRRSRGGQNPMQPAQLQPQPEIPQRGTQQLRELQRRQQQAAAHSQRSRRITVRGRLLVPRRFGGLVWLLPLSVVVCPMLRCMA